MSRVALPTISAGTFGFAWWANRVKGNDEDHESRLLARAIALQAAVAGVQSASFVDVPYPIDWVAIVSGDVAVTYYSKATNAATAVQLRLYDVTASAAVSGSTSTANSTTSGWTPETKTPVTVVAGHSYRLQITGADALNPVIGYATLL